MACNAAIAASSCVGIIGPGAGGAVTGSPFVRPLPTSLWGVAVHATPRSVSRPKLKTFRAWAAKLSEQGEARNECGCGPNRRDVLLGVAFSAAALSARPADAATGKVAVATLVPTKGSTAYGEVTFTEKTGFFGGKKVKVDVNVGGLSPGLHGFHIHEVGNVTCDDGLCTGGHYNPSKQPHGSPSSKERHVGDLGNILADKDGKVQTTLEDTVISLDGASSIVGHSVVVHFGQDDLASQPSGNAGGRAAYATVRLV